MRRSKSALARSCFGGKCHISAKAKTTPFSNKRKFVNKTRDLVAFYLIHLKGSGLKNVILASLCGFYSSWFRDFCSESICWDLIKSTFRLLACCLNSQLYLVHNIAHLFMCPGFESCQRSFYFVLLKLRCIFVTV